MMKVTKLKTSLYQLKILSSLILLALGLTSCTNTHELSNSDRSQFVTEFYAYVYNVHEVEFESQAEEAALTWGLWGALENSHGNRSDIFAGAIVSAVLGGMITSFMEGPNDGFEYQLDAIDGDRVTVVVDYYPADPGDCVMVRVAGKVDIYAQPKEFCEDEQFN